MQYRTINNQEFRNKFRYLFETLAHVLAEKCAPPCRIGGAKAHFVNNKNRFNLFKKVFSLMALELASSHALQGVKKHILN